MIAAIDESVRSTGRGLYIVGLVLIPPADVGRVRDDLRRLLPARQQRFHWAKESDQLRNRMIDYVREAARAAAAYVTVEPWRKRDAARSRCLTALCEDHGSALSGMLIESRDDHLDHRDRRP